MTETRPEIEILFFGPLAELAGRARATLPRAEGGRILDVDALSRRIAETYPALAGRSYAIAIDREIVRGNRALDRAETVALLPPFSGG